MESFNWNLLFGIIVVVLIVGISYFFRSRPRCPECKSYKVGVVKKEPQTAISHVQPGSEGQGPHTTATIFYRVQYRCNDCQETWVTTVAESK